MRHSLIVITIVVATDKKRVIGEGNKIPWRVKSDLGRLANLTRGHTVILGRKTYDSMVWYYNRSGKRMPGKYYIVLTHDEAYSPGRDNVTIAFSVDEALATAQEFGDPQVFVIGGGSIFKEFLPYTDVIYLTEVQTEVKGDSYFPELDMAAWSEVSREHHTKNERDEFDTEVIVLERRK
jgi:dihydrofolate reductase